MDNMIIEYIRYKVGLPEREAFVEAYGKGAQQLNSSPYCLGFELSECVEEPGQFMVRIEWTSTDDHLNGFRKSEGFRDFFTNVKPFFNNIQEMRHYQVNEVKPGS